MSTDSPSPALVQQIENNLLLKQALDQLSHIERTQESNHLVSIQLRDHQTIERVDAMWTSMGQLHFLTKLIAGLLGSMLLLIPVLTYTHLVWRWPW